MQRQPEPWTICDFCGSGSISYRYPAETFNVSDIIDPAFIPWGSEGDWAACRECSELIEQDRRFDLALRAKIDRSLSLDIQSELYLMVYAMQEKFFEHRKGDRVKLNG